jgi:NADPH-dependent curcumin reductase CurA
MIGGTAGEVIESRNPSFAPGDQVVGMAGRNIVVSGGIRRSTPRIPLPAHFARLEQVTAWYGLSRIYDAKAGQTIAVTAAGAVGSVVGQAWRKVAAQLIRRRPRQMPHVIDELGFDACIDYKAHTDPKAPTALEGGNAERHRWTLREHRWRGARRRAAAHERPRSMRLRHDQRLTASRSCPLSVGPADVRLMLQGFIVSEHMEHWPAASSLKRWWQLAS